MIAILRNLEDVIGKLRTLEACVAGNVSPLDIRTQTDKLVIIRNQLFNREIGVISEDENEAFKHVADC